MNLTSMDCLQTTLTNFWIFCKSYGFDAKEIATKLYSIQELEWNEKQLKGKCRKLSKRISKYKDVVSLTEDIAALQIGIDELIALKVGINEAAKLYKLPFLTATLQLINDIKKYNKINGLGLWSIIIWWQCSICKVRDNRGANNIIE